MTVIGVDDTDSRDRGMCTTFLAAQLAAALEKADSVSRILLVRLNPGVPHKTRGNAAIAIHTDHPLEAAYELAVEAIETNAETTDPNTHPGLVIAPGSPEEVPDSVDAFARQAIQDYHTIDDAQALIDANGYRAAWWKTGRGRIGALAAVGAWAAFDEWTYEYIAYRVPDRWGTPREFDDSSVTAAAETAYPAAWDTVDRVEDQAVCVPHTPGPVLYGIRGDDPATVQSVSDRIQSEPVASSQLFVTNQGTDAHLRDASLGDVRDDRSYRVTGTVAADPVTRAGGHVFFPLEDDDARVECAAFEPTKRFRDHVRALKAGDRITACGEVTDNTLKLEKFAVRSLTRFERRVPSCPTCHRSMESAGADQGYRCRDCRTTRPGKTKHRVERDLTSGWYEVPPCARRHIAKPLIRGGFDAPIHPER